MGLEFKLYRIDEEKYLQEAEYLKQQIVTGSNRYQFLTINHEAGFGKTLLYRTSIDRSSNSRKEIKEMAAILKATLYRNLK